MAKAVSGVHKHVNWKMILYLVTTSMYLAVLFLIYAAVRGIWRFKVEFAYWPDQPLQVDVAGCDVVLMSTSNSVGTVKLHGEWARMDSAYENDVHEIEGVEGKHRPIQSLDIFSSNCNADPMMLCSRSCRVEISIPSNPDFSAAPYPEGYQSGGDGFIRITQHADDTSKQLVVYNIGDLDLTVPIRVAGPTVRLALGENEYGGTSVAVNAEISAYLTVGDAVLSSATLGPSVSVTLSSSKSNVRAMVAATENIDTKIRSGNNFVCMMAAAPARVTRVPSKDTAEACDAEGQSLAAGNEHLMKYYNPDDTQYVSIDPFRTALTEKMGKCCGVYCPPSSFETWRVAKNCDDVVQAVFPNQTSAATSGRFGRLKGGDFLNNLIAADDATLLPLCRPAAAISIVDEMEADTGASLGGVGGGADDGSGEYGADAQPYQLSGATDRNASLLLMSDAGEARIVAAKDVNNVVGATTTFYKPAGASPGLRLNEDSAKQLAVFRDEYGSRFAERDAYLTIHVPETDEHPGGVFIYSSNSVFLSLSPSFLSVIGGFALLPETEQVMVHFVSDDCGSDTYSPTGGTWSKDDVRYEERLAQVHATLIRALTPFAQLSMRGKLVRLPSQAENTELCEELHTLSFEGVPQEYVMQGSKRVTQMNSRKWKRRVKACEGMSLFYPQFQVLHPELKVSLDGTVDCIDDGFNANNTETDCQNGIFAAETSFQGQNKLAMKVLTFSFVVAAIIGTFLMHIVTSKSKEKLKKRYSEFEISYKLGARHALPPSENITKSKYFMPFEIPVELFQVVIPYRGLFIDSLKRFFRYQYRPIAPEGALSRTCWTVRGYKNNTLSKSEMMKGSASKGTIADKRKRSEEIAAEIEHATQDLPATELQHYEMQGIPLLRFKQRYNRYCLDNQLSEVTDPMDVREFFMLKETDPGATLSASGSGFKIRVRKQRTVKGVTVDFTVLEQLKELNARGILQHVLESALLESSGKLKRKKSFLDGLEGLLSCCNPFSIDIQNAKRHVHVNGTVLDYAMEQLTRERKLESDQFWNTATVVLFVSMCTRLRKSTKIAMLAEQRKVAVVHLKGTNVVHHGAGKQRHVSTLADFATYLLEFQRILEDAQIDKAALVSMMKGSNFKPAQMDAEVVGQSELLPTMKTMAPDELAGLLKEALGIEVSKGQASRKTISNVRLAWESELEGFPSWADFKEACIDVATQMTVLVVLPCALFMLVAAYGQGIYAMTNGAASRPLSSVEYLLGVNFIAKDEQLNISGVPANYAEVGWTTNQDGRGSLLWADWMYFISLAYGIFWVVRLTYSYYGPENSVARRVVFKSFAIALTVVVWVFCIWVAMGAIWLMFSAILDPEANLVKGVILVMVVTVVAKLAARLFALKSKVMEAVHRRLDALLHNKIGQFIQKNPAVAANVSDQADEADSREIPMDEIFAILDSNSNNTLTFDEFNNLFDMIEMCIPLDEQQRMFQFADVDGNGTIALDEFQAAWTYLKDGVVVTLLKRLGLDDGDILWNVATLLGFFLICIPLFLAMISLWDNTTSFVSVIHSLFIGATGILANGKKAKAEAKDGEVNGMDESIDSMLKGFGETSQTVAASTMNAGGAQVGMTAGGAVLGAGFGFGGDNDEQVSF